MSDIIAIVQQSASSVSSPNPSSATAQSTAQRPSQPQHIMDSRTAEATCKKTVSVLALDAGFEGITASALDTLTRAMETYTQQMYFIAHSFAELAGRTQPNVHDLQQAFRDLNLKPASLGAYIRRASHSKTPLLRGPLQETIAKKQRKKEKKTVLLDSDIEDNLDSDEEDASEGQTGTSTPGARVTARTIVPDHLPPFPSKHSYKQTPVFVKRPTDPQKIRELNAEQSRLVESNLKKLMATENKVAMAAAHRDGSVAPTAAAADLLMVKEEPESLESIDRRALTKLESLPVVSFESSRRQQQLSASNRDKGPRHHTLHELQGGHHRGESMNNDLASGGSGGATASGSGLSIKSEWRRERRRLRREQQSILEEMDQNLNHKRIRQESGHASRPKFVSMEVDQ